MLVLGTSVIAVCFLSSLAPASEQVQLTSPLSCVTLDELLHISEPQFPPLQKYQLIPSSNYKTIKTQKSLAQPPAQIPVTSEDSCSLGAWLTELVSLLWVLKSPVLSFP